jgi:hypothetical protein
MARRCGYCGNTGHNRRTCPSGIQTRVADTTEVTVVNKRRCSYCNWKGVLDGSFDHNRRNCPILNQDLQKAYAENAKYRSGIIKIFQEAGIGPGSLVFAYTRYNGKSVRMPHLLESISLKLTTCHCGSYSRHAVYVLTRPSYDIGRTAVSYFRLPQVNGTFPMWDPKLACWNFVDLNSLSARTSSHLLRTPSIDENISAIPGDFDIPDGWLSGEDRQILDFWKEVRKP